MNTEWKIAGVQMDCKLADKQANLDSMRAKIGEAAAQGARLIAFPECTLTGYCFDSKEAALEHAEPVPGPSTVDLALTCRQLDVWIIYGLLERDDERMFNAAALVGPDGLVASYRKVHLPFLGVDRFNEKGDQPFAIHDVAGLKVGMCICYDGSFPESVRVLTLLGADLVVLPTNWPAGTECNARHMIPARAYENHIYFAAVNRVGEEAGFRFFGESKIVDCRGEPIAACEADKEEIIYAEIDYATARKKHEVRVPGKHEIDRIADRRPEMYGQITAENKEPAS